MTEFLPEQFTSEVPTYRVEDIRKAIEKKKIITGVATKCDSNLTLEIRINNKITGTIPLEEFEYNLMGKVTKNVAVVSRVGKQVNFIVQDLVETSKGYVAKLSRREAQKKCYEEYISKFQVGQVIDAKVTYVESYGLFCDIGCGIPAILPLENVCVTRIDNPKVALSKVRKIKAVVKNIDGGKITLTHKELLGTWEDEVSEIHAGDTICGTVRVIESYGVFVEISPNLTGLAEPCTGIASGDSVTAFVKAVIPEKMKVKLMIVSKNDEMNTPGYTNFNYRLPESGFIRDWVYSTPSASKKVESHF